jgi:hypothetical protein
MHSCLSLETSADQVNGGWLEILTPVYRAITRRALGPPLVSTGNFQDES